MNEIVEMIYQWHQGMKIKAINRSLGFDRKTIQKYVGMAQQVGVKQNEPFPEEQHLLQRLQSLSRASVLYETPALRAIGVHRDQIAKWLEEKEMTGKQIWRLLKEAYGLSVGYSSIKRYLKKEFQMGFPRATVHLESSPGKEAQVDFGNAGMFFDPEQGRKRRAWAFVMTLSYSRHRFVRLVFRQDVATWIDCHIRAFNFFRGVPASIILDNLKSGVAKPDIYDPTLNQAYGELERHYGFVADPAKIRTPEHKGKVERVIPVVRKHLLAGREFRDVYEANERALTWCREEIGREIHGTTGKRPFELFLEEERGHLHPLPEAAFEIALWKECKVHPDHHIVFDRSYYSVPTRYIGQQVWARGDSKQVRIFYQHEQIKVHMRSFVPRSWVTDQQDYPPEKLAYLMATPTWCRQKAAAYGPFTEQFVKDILQDHAMRYLRKAQAVLRLGEKYGPDLERACERALAFGNYRYKSLKAILEKNLASKDGGKSRSSGLLSPLGKSFLRPPEYFLPGVHP